MRLAVVILILIGHLTAIAAVRCHTVWHKVLPSDPISSTVVESTHDPDHPLHPTVFLGFGGDHDHPKESPDHSHVPVPHGVAEAARVQSVVPELVLPFAYVELSRVLLPALEPARLQFALGLSDPPACVSPLSGSTTHLLF